MLGRLISPGWTLLLALCSGASPALAQDEGALPEGPAGAATVAPAVEPEEATETPSTLQNSVTPNYVVWRIKPGTGGGALAPRLERRLRKEMEAKLGGLMLSKAAQTGIILIRPELADCDANLPCALDVAEALSIRFVVGGEAQSTATTSFTAWIVDKNHGSEVRRVTVPIQGTGEAAETAAVVALRDALLTPPRVPQPEAKTAPVEGESAPEAHASGKPWLGGLLLAGAGTLGGLSVVTLLAGVAALGSAGALLALRSAYHTRTAFNGMVGTAATGGGLLALGAMLLVAALPVAALGAWSLLGMGGP